MRYEEDPSNVFGARYWAESQADEFHAMQLLKATGPVHEIVAYIDAVPAPRMTGSVPAAVTQAAAALSELDSQQRLHASANASGPMERALGALRSLEKALRDEEEDLCLELADMSSYLSDPPALESDLRYAVGKFLCKQMSAYYDRVATFSLILFTEEMHNGKLLASLQGERIEWRRALRPPRRGVSDFHLAIIPPPSAVDGIRYLAAELRCQKKLPCVVFLGKSPEFSHPTSTTLISWGARTLTREPPAYPDQLRDVYRSVYACGALAPGSPSSALMDKLLTRLSGAINPRGALRLLAGALGGSELVTVAESVLPEE